MGSPGGVVQYGHSDGRPFVLTWHPAPFRPPPESTTQALGLCFTGQGEMVLIQFDDGRWSLPGGTIEDGETAEEALVREVAEEACARVTDFAYIGAQEVDDPERLEGPRHHFQTRFWCRVELHEWDPHFETTARRLVAPELFLSALYWGDTPIAPELLRLSLEIEGARS